MPLINCEINLILTWSKNCVISSATRETKFLITDSKLYVPVVTLPTQDNEKLPEQLKFGLERTINWNKYQSKRSTQNRNPYLDYLTDPKFCEVKRLFVQPFEDRPTWQQGVMETS